MAFSSEETVVPPPASGNSTTTSGTGGHQNVNVLSEKVQRALQVRTDTPAMKAALDALAHLPAHTVSGGSAASSGQDSKHEEEQNNNNNSTSHINEDAIVDSRSVRVAIEQDALHQALLLQEELKTLVDTVATLRQGVTDTAAIADRMYDGIHTDVTVNLQTSKPPENQMLPPKPKSQEYDPYGDGGGEGEEGGGESSTHSNNNNNTTTTVNRILEESQLARTLHDAFSARDQAQQRLTVIQAFLEKFDLSEQDSRLLDHYNFEDVSAFSEGESPVNGMAFLKALQRVVQIRKALSETFGPTAAGSGGSTTGTSNSNSDNNNYADKQGLGASSALRMMESLAQKQEQAYERLYHWLQQYLQLHPTASSGSGGDTGDSDRLDEVLSHPFCQLALQTLQHVPAFYAHMLELIANARRSQATKQFLLALTSGYGGMPPLEMKAHDAVAYVGDMLAFCFRAFSVEADFAKQMRTLQTKSVTLDKKDTYDGNEEGGDEDGDETEPNVEEKELDIMDNPNMQPTLSAQETLALTMSGVARPLKSRIVQVIATLARSMHDGSGGGGNGEDDDDDGDDVSHDSMMDDLEEEGGVARQKVTQLYEICGLLLFYASAMENVEKKLDMPPGQASTRNLQVEDNDDEEDSPQKGEQSPLIKAVVQCLSEATSSYEATFRVYAAMMDNLAVLSGHSEASLANRIIVSLADCRVASPGFSQDVPCPKEFRTTLALDWALEVILEASLNTCKTLDDALLLQQAIEKAKKAGLGDSAATLTARVQEKESQLIDELVTSETSQVLEMCGLGTIASAWKNFKEASAEGGALNSTMAAYPGLSPEEVEESMKEFYSSLYSPPLPSLEGSIKDPVLRKTARKKIAKRVCSLYEEVYQAIVAEHESGAGGYDKIDFLGHSPEQVATLFTA